MLHFFLQFLVSVNPSTICYDTSASGSLPVISAASVQTSAICCPSYEKRLLVSTRTDLNAAFGMYNPPQTTASLGYASYLPCSSDPTAFYSTLVSSNEFADKLIFSVLPAHFQCFHKQSKPVQN